MNAKFNMCLHINSLRCIAPYGVRYLVQHSLRWRHNDHGGVSNHQPHHCLLNRLFRRRSWKTSKLRVTGLCVGKSPGPVNSPNKGPVTRKMFPFDDVIVLIQVMARTQGAKPLPEPEQHLVIGPLRPHSNEIWIRKFSFKKMHLKTPFAK